MMPLRSLRSRVVHLEEEKSKENDKVDSRIKQKKMPLTVISCDDNKLKDPKNAKTLDVATLKKKPVIENVNENNSCTVNESGKENIINKRNLRNRSEKLLETKLSMLKENNTNLQNIASVMKNKETKNKKSVKEKAKLNSKRNSSKPSGDKKTCNLLQTQLPVLKENDSNTESEGAATITKIKKNGTVKKEAKSKTQNKPSGKINCMRIDSYFKRPSKENNCVVEGTETEVNTVRKVPIWKISEVSKTVQAKEKQRRSSQDVYNISFDEDLLASSKKSKNTKTRVNQMKKRVKKDNKKRFNYPKCSIKTKCTSVKVDKVLAKETKVVTPGDFGAKTASEEKQNNLPKITNKDNNGFHDGNKNQNIPEPITNNVEIADVHHTENEIQSVAAESFDINDSDEILKRSEQIVNVNNIEKADVLKGIENRNFSSASFEIDDHPNEILELSDYGVNNVESAGVSNETENMNVPTTPFEIDNPNEILTEPSDVQQSKYIANRKNVTELADQLERSFQIYLTSTPDRSHKSRIPAQRGGIFNVADLSNITVINSNCLNDVSTPTGSSSVNVAMPTVTTDAEINNKDNDVIAESLSIVEPPPKKKSKKDTADITLFESPKKNVEKKKKKKQKPISFYLFQDLEAPSAELEESVLKPKKTYKEADNFKVHIMKTKRNAAAAAKQAAKKSKVDILMDSMIKHFEEIGSTEFCIEKV